MQATHFIVQTASAAMPSSVKAPYRRVAVLEVDAGLERVAMISERARGVRAVVATWERCFAGTNGGNTAYDRALRDAREMADRLNAEAKAAL